MPVKIACPNAQCGAEYVVPENRVGTIARCKKCGQDFTLRMSKDETRKAWLPPPASPKGKTPPPPRQKTPAPAGVVPSNIRSDHPTGSPAGVLPFQKLGPYLVRSWLGSGAMGDVWLAHDPDLRRDVAIKTLRSEYAQDPEFLQRFFREAASAARLHHTNTMAIYRVDSEGKTPYIAMEFIDGVSLDKIIKRQGSLPWRDATEIIRDAAAGLAAAHELGLVHRDIKPANLMRTTRGITKVVDFGLARATSSSTEISRTGVLLGTPAYMAPELWLGKPADASSDIYALTLTYFHLLAGRPPFEAEQSIQVGYQHRYEPLPDPRQFVPNLPERLVMIPIRRQRSTANGRFVMKLSAPCSIRKPSRSSVWSDPPNRGPASNSVTTARGSNSPTRCAAANPAMPPPMTATRRRLFPFRFMRLIVTTGITRRARSASDWARPAFLPIPRCHPQCGFWLGRLLRSSLQDAAACGEL
jgi:serine/threonine protein kinase